MKKQLKNLTIKDNFMFAAVMLDKENCKGFLERALQIKIDHVEVCTEKNIVYHPEYKGVRLDVYAKDENNTRYNVEMQVSSQSALGLRSRYYQSQMDMEMLLSGCEYSELPNSYVIFICDFDPYFRIVMLFLFVILIRLAKRNINILLRWNVQKLRRLNYRIKEISYF